MKQVLFYDKGYEKTGKSASIKAVFRELASRVSKEDVKRLEAPKMHMSRLILEELSSIAM